jgi:hypothetical protein
VVKRGATTRVFNKIRAVRSCVSAEVPRRWMSQQTYEEYPANRVSAEEGATAVRFGVN